MASAPNHRNLQGAQLLVACAVWCPWRSWDRDFGSVCPMKQTRTSPSKSWPHPREKIIDELEVKSAICAWCGTDLLPRLVNLGERHYLERRGNLVSCGTPCHRYSIVINTDEGRMILAKHGSRRQEF